MSELAVITGTTHGIGRVTARELARAGRTVVMLCRDLKAGEAVRYGLLRETPAARVELVRCDLASLASVRAAAALVRRDYPRLGLLINNAGMVSTRRRTSADGFELTFATNHLGPFLLTALLSEHLDRAARIVTVASRIHYRGRLDLASITDTGARYRPTAAYAQSKLANVMHTFALARRLAGTGITVNCLHPGVVATHLLPRWLRTIKPLMTRVMFDAERGARTTLYLALEPRVAALTGQYFDEYQQPRAASPLASDFGLQELLWKASVAWTNAPMGQDAPSYTDRKVRHAG
ncbi:MAG: SDR family oxidoreductase [Sinobacteraceae bacterium]|nr:SDR family oxidoreductase [Nevskiaceae bacterium]